MLRKVIELVKRFAEGNITWSEVDEEAGWESV
jgi:hypothetical protein